MKTLKLDSKFLSNYLSSLNFFYFLSFFSSSSSISAKLYSFSLPFLTFFFVNVQKFSIFYLFLVFHAVSIVFPSYRQANNIDFHLFTKYFLPTEPFLILLQNFPFYLQYYAVSLYNFITVSISKSLVMVYFTFLLICHISFWDFKHGQN